MMPKEAVLLDTSFFIRLLDRDDPLHSNAIGYFKYLTENDFELLISTISIAEYCIRGDIHDLPLRNLQIIAFNLNHAKRTGEFARIAFEERANKKLQVNNRTIIPNDTKLFAQADCEKTATYYLSSDTESIKVYHAIHSKLNVNFKFIDLNTPYNETFGVFDL